MILLAEYTKLFPIWFCLSDSQFRYSGHHSTTPGMRLIIHYCGDEQKRTARGEGKKPWISQPKKDGLFKTGRRSEMNTREKRGEGQVLGRDPTGQ